MTLPPTVRAVIFDNDGTLVLSYPGILRAWVAWCEEYGIDPHRLAGFDGHSSDAIVRALIGDDAAAQGVARVDEIEVEEAHDTVPQPGALAALAAVPVSRLAIATSGTRAVAAARLEAAGIEMPPVFVCFDDVTHAKPDPEIFQVACDRLGVEPSDCLVVEDAPAGVEAGKAAGCPVVAVTTTVAREKLLAADAVVDSLEQVTLTAGDDGRIRVVVDETPAATTSTPASLAAATEQD